MYDKSLEARIQFCVTHNSGKGHAYREKELRKEIKAIKEAHRVTLFDCGESGSEVL